MLRTIKKALAIGAILALIVYLSFSRTSTVRFADQVPIWHKAITVLHLYGTELCENAGLVPAGSLDTALVDEAILAKNHE